MVEEEGIDQSDILSLIRWQPQSLSLKKFAHLWGVLDPDRIHTPMGWPFIGGTTLHVLAAIGLKDVLKASLQKDDVEIH